MGDSEKYESLLLRNQLCFPVYLCAKEITRRYTPLLDELNLTYTQYIVMMYFWEKQESNVKEIGDTLLLDPSTLTPLLKKLEDKGYISRTRSDEDERNLVVKVTEKGLKLREKAVQVPEKMGKCINLSPEEAKALYNLMYKVLKNVKKEQYD
ncbi:MarR family transcriptional regulator [Candidatus Saccharibacteria bacterium]|nr:MarR family transcriptional regulator [Candidatus Saccharibacteria bacterium]